VKESGRCLQGGGYAYQPANAHRLCTSPAVVSRVAELSADRYEDERKAREIATNEAVRPWWKTDPSGQVVMSVKFGAKPLEFEKGRPTALGLSIVAATYSTWVFNRKKVFDRGKLRPLLLSSLPTALIGGHRVGRGRLQDHGWSRTSPCRELDDLEARDCGRARSADPHSGVRLAWVLSSDWCRASPASEAAFFWRRR
jgi:hypothetical protein